MKKRATQFKTSLTVLKKGAAKKMMEKVTNSPWSLRILALAFSLLLFVYVNNENTKQFSPDNRSGGATVNSSEMITDLPVVVNVDQERYYVTGLPDTASILLEGSTAILLNTVTTENFDIVTPNLNELGEGTYTVSLMPEGLSNELDYTVYPSEVTVNVQERASDEYDVSVAFDESLLAKGYEAGTAIIDSPTVTIEGAAATLDEIAEVQAIVPVEEGTNRDISETVPVVVTDGAGNELDVRVTPSEVTVTVPVESNTKEVPISLIQTGAPDSGDTYELALAEGQESTISVVGNQAALENLSEVGVPVDVTGITETTTLTVDVPIPQGASSVEPESIEVEVTVSSEETEAEPNNEEEPAESSAAEEESGSMSSGDNTEESENVDSSRGSTETSESAESETSQSSETESESSDSEVSSDEESSSE